MPTENKISTRWLLIVIQKESFGMSLLETKAKVRSVQQAVWSGLFDAVPDLTNREESIFADTEGNVCAEVVLSGTLTKEFAGMMSPIRNPSRFYPKDRWRRDSNTTNSGVLGSSKSLIQRSRICIE
jgi:hypothetical protein